MKLSIKKLIAKLPFPFWLSFYIFLILIAIPTLAYLGTFNKAAPGDWTWQRATNDSDQSNMWASISSSDDGTKLIAATRQNGAGSVFTSDNGGMNWTKRDGAGVGYWSGVSSSDDGTKLVAVASSNYIYTSSDSGANWIQRTSAGNRGWISVTSSSDGMKIVAVVSNGYIYTSSDSGTTWTEQTSAGNRQWTSVASSSSGDNIVASVWGSGSNYIYTSSDSGTTWTEQTSSGSRSWTSVTSSSDGTKLVASTDNGYIYSSTDSGSTWSQLSAAGSRKWTSVLSSSNGANLFATSGDFFSKGYIFTSSDYGNTWIQQTSAGYRSWRAIASSDDGSKIGAVEYGGFINVSSDSGVSWQQIDGTGSRRWISTASSEDGSKLVAASTSFLGGDYIYTSSDYGVNWTLRSNSGNRVWSSVASSYDGTKLIATATDQFGDYLFASSDSGVNWVQLTSAGSRMWSSVASSSDGTKLVATAGGSSGGYIYTSSDSGATWTARNSAGSRKWTSASSSPDGTKLVAVVNNDYIYTSSDSGATWAARNSAGSRQWQDVDMSDDGVNIIAVVYGGYAYQSSDSGNTWTQISSIGSKSWASTIMSNDGSKLVAAAGDSGSGEYLYTSIDFGASWTQQSTAGSRNWASVASSSDGTRVLASSINGPLYTGYLDGFSPPSPFIMRVKTDNPGVSGNNQYIIPTNNGNYTYNYNVDCNNDGTPEHTNQTGDVTCTYGAPGTYDIAISGTFPHMYQSSNGDPEKIIDVKQWGDIEWQDMTGMFSGASNISVFTATDTPNLSQVTSIDNVFANATSFNTNINNWDVSNITSMHRVFEDADVFNQPLDNWDVSNVVDMFGLFYGTDSFNQPLNNWDVSNVTNMSQLFMETSAFNQPLNNWDVSNVVDMSFMFGWEKLEDSVPFNQPLNNWDVSNVTNMEAMFLGAQYFNQNLNNWDTSAATNMVGMFGGATAFNQPLNDWDVSNVTDMSQMFMRSDSFNQPLNNWDTSSLDSVFMMFMFATSFDQPLDNWDVSGITEFDAMFANATEFDQSLASWDVSNAVAMPFMFGDFIMIYRSMYEQYLGRTYDQWTQLEKDTFYSQISISLGFTVTESYIPNPSGLSTANYDATLIAWSAQNLEQNVPFDAGTSKYCNAETQRQNIITNFTWTINDAGKDCSAPLGIPQNLTGISHSTSIELNWDDVTGADHYTVQYKQATSNTWTTYTDSLVAGSYLEVTGLTPSTFYDFRVRAVDSQNNQSDWSDVLKTSTLALQIYHITNCQQLQSISINPITFEFGDTTASYILDNDIDCTESANWTWEGISELESPGGGFIGILDIPNSQPFTGTFDGQGHTISNLTQDFVPGGGGLFAWTQGSELKDVIISNSYVNNPGISPLGGGFAGRVVDTIISNVHVKQLNMSNDYFASGGLVAFAEGSTTITRSSAEGIMNIHSASSGLDSVATGGLIGYVGVGMAPTYIDHSYADMDINITLTNYGWQTNLIAGGLTGGSSDGFGIIENSYSLGSININATNELNNNFFAVGGLSGNAVFANNAYSATPISIQSNGFYNDDDWFGVGGLVGIQNFEIVNSFVTGEINTDDALLTPGGLTGIVGGFPEDIAEKIENSYYDKSITDTTNCVYTSININDSSVIMPEPAFDCHPINTDGSQPNYFKNNTTNPPLNQWDFTNIWSAHVDKYPDFVPDVVATAPSAPLSPSITEITTTSMKLNWSPPADDGGSAITSYQVQYKASSSGTWISAPVQGPSPTTHVLTNLSPNTSYDFKVSAINSIGSSPYTNPVTGTTLNTPIVDPPVVDPPQCVPTPTNSCTPQPPKCVPSATNSCTSNPQPPTTNEDTNTPEPGTPVYSPTTKKPTISPNKSNQTVKGSFMASLVNQARKLPKPAARAIPYTLLALLLALASLYAYSSYMETKRRQAIQALVARFKSMLAARATYLRITSHYISTPITKMQGVVELLASGITSTSSNSSSTSKPNTTNSSTNSSTNGSNPDSNSHSSSTISSNSSSSSSDSNSNNTNDSTSNSTTPQAGTTISPTNPTTTNPANTSSTNSSSNPTDSNQPLPPPVALAASVTTLTIPEDSIVAAKSGLKSLANHSAELLAEGQSLTGTQQANIRNLEQKKGLSFLTNPNFWLPVVVISTIVVLLNFIFIQANRYTPTAITILSQLLLGFVGIIALGVSYYFYRQQKATTALLQTEQTIEQEFNTRQANFISEATNKLNDDLLLLEGISKDIAKYPKVAGFTDGLKDLKQIVAQLDKLSNLNKHVPGLNWSTDLSKTIAKASQDLQDLADQQDITITTNNLTPGTMVAIETEALTHLIAAPLKNAIQASNQGNQVTITQTTNPKDKTHPIRLTITDQGKGIPANKLQDIFKPFNSAHSLERFTDTGLGLDLYLAKVVTEAYNATIDITSQEDIGTTTSIGLGRAG